MTDVILHSGGPHGRIMFTAPDGRALSGAEEIAVAEHFLGEQHQFTWELRQGDRSRVASSWDEFNRPSVK